MSTYTEGLLYMHFSHIQVQGSITTDPKEIYFLPLGGEFVNAKDVGDWFLETAEKIKSERLFISKKK